MDPEEAEVKAAGCAVWRGDPPEFAVAHRPHRADWSLPKGKLDPGEDWATAARREVGEEIGVHGVLGAELPPVFYDDHKGRAKAVRYWLMEAGSAGDAPFVPNDEVDEVVWLPADQALELLTHASDRETIARAAEELRSRP
jgi:8-oxo-dGTP diphosphatase